MRECESVLVRAAVPSGAWSGKCRVCRVVVCWLAVVCLVLVVCGGGAFAATGHGFVASISEGPLGTPLLEPSSVAVERASGDVFVGDRLSGYVDVYGSAGGYVTQFGEGRLDPAGIAVDEASGDVYVADPSAEGVLVYEPDGAGGYRLLARWFGRAVPGEEFGRVSGVGVDNSKGPSQGDLYVLEGEIVGGQGGAVDVYRPKPNPSSGAGEEGEFLGRLSGVKLEGPNAVAVSATTGRLLVADSHKGDIYAFSAEGVYEERWNGKESPNGPFGKDEARGNVAAVAVDEGSGDVYVAEAERHAVSQYSAKGVWEGWVTSTPAGGLSDPQGVALTPAGDVYVADAGLALADRFSAGVVVPDVKTGKVGKSGLTRTSATLAGTINGDGKAAAYRFQYGETTALGSTTSAQASGTGEASVVAEVAELLPGRTYHYRIVGENEDGANAGVIRTFATLPAVEGLSTGPVKNIAPEGATVTGTLNPDGFDTHYYFQWGASSAYGNTIPAPPGTDAGSGTSLVEAETTVSGLIPNSTYHYRLVGDNSFGVTYGADETFTTSGPPRITLAPVSGIGQHEATIQAQINPDQLATTYHFEYGETTAYGTEVPLGGEAIGAGFVPVPVSASLSGLKVGTTYHYRVVAKNEFAGHKFETRTDDQTFATLPPAPVDSMFASNVGPSEAVLHARINPLGSETHYYFQYGTQACQENPNGCTNNLAPPGEDIGSGTEGVAGEAKLIGLQAGTTYHYRVIDSNELGVTEGPERTFTTQEEAGAFALADGRAWEMVSPPEKGGAPIESLPREDGVIRAANDGHALTYVVNGGLGEEVEGNRSPEWQQVLATRTPSGWSSKDIATPNSQAKGITAGSAPEYQFFSSQLSVALVEPAELAGTAEPPLAPGVTQATMYLRDNETGSYLPLVTEANTAPGTQFGEHVHFLSASSDLSHVVLESEVGLTGPTAPHPAGPFELYEWSGGQLQLVSVLPGGKTASEGELGFFDRVLAHAISSDGSRVIWTNKEDLTMLGGHLYMRDTVKGETIQLDRPARGVAEADIGSAQFQTASSDGSRVFFTDKQPLTSDSTAEASQGAGKPDLYECVIEEVAGRLSCDLKDLTVDHHEHQHADVQNFIFGASEDGTSVYLVAQGVLASNTNGNGETAINGRDNLYQLHYDGSEWSTLFIATLSGEDAPEWEGEHVADTAYLTARVSPNGRYLAFMSAAPITGYDNTDASAQANGARDEEVFLYDSTTASLRCVSCNPTGARPAGVFDQNQSGEGLGLVVDRRRVWLNRWIAGNIPGWTAQTLGSGLFQSRYLSDEGRLYFNSPDRLVPAAANSKEDVYQYEPAGVGNCQSPSGGCVSLISGGSSDRESAFIEATPDGSNVFFVTEARLLPSQDTDTAFDIYDARECTASSPCIPQPPEQPAPCAETKTCRPAETAQPIPAGPAGTATTSGPGNVVAQTQNAKQQVQGRRAFKPLNRAQELQRALKRCRKHHAHSKKKLTACERKARKRYGKHKHKAKHRRKAKTGTAGRERARR
jgi:hypothetical protein